MSAPESHPGPSRLLGRTPFLGSLSGRLLLFTVVFVMLAEVLIYVPSIANFRVAWLEERLAAAQIASLALEANMRDKITQDLENELLDNAGVLQVVLRRNETRMLMLAKPDLPMVDATYDLRMANPLRLIADAFRTLLGGKDRVILVEGTPEHGGGELIEVIVEENELRGAMLGYSRNILTLSIIISVFAAVLVFMSFKPIFVKPMRRITMSMVSFRLKPEDADRIMKPSSNVKEVRMAEEELAAMQTELRNSLQQKTRLAALGTAVSKINHDLRNILASAQLISDRITLSDDPKVQSLAPKLVASIDRAVDLTLNTLKFGKAEEPAPRKSEIDLAVVVDDVGAHVGLTDGGHITWSNNVPRGWTVHADGDHLFRIFLNLGRNAAEAIGSRVPASRHDKIEVAARRHKIGGRAVIAIDVSDTGPGLSDKAKEHLFEAFAGSGRAGGTGLGLAIAKELSEANGGDIQLVRSGRDGTTFRVTLPAAPA